MDGNAARRCAIPKQSVIRSIQSMIRKSARRFSEKIVLQ